MIAFLKMKYNHCGKTAQIEKKIPFLQYFKKEKLKKKNFPPDFGILCTNSSF